jgi:plastocyanin
VLSYAFSPSEVTISKGGSVTWVFLGGTVPHSSMGTGGESWGSGAMYSGSFEYTFNSTGIFTFACGLHGSMTGKVTVID